MISVFTVIVILVHQYNDLFPITGSKTTVSTNFSPKRSFLYVVLAQAFLPYNGSQEETKFLLSLFSFSFV